MEEQEFYEMLLYFAKLVYDNSGAWEKFIDDLEYSLDEKEQFTEMVRCR